MPRVVHFEVSADDPARAAQFYEGVFGWKVRRFDAEDDYWLAETGDAAQPGINGGIMKRVHPSQRIVNTLEVPSIEDFVAKVTSNGGKVTMPRTAVPGVGWLAYCEDPEGNPFGLMQPDAGAK